MSSRFNSLQPLLRKEAFSSFCEGLDHPEGLAFDCDQNLWAGGELGRSTEWIRGTPRGGHEAWRLLSRANILCLTGALGLQLRLASAHVT